MLGTKEPVICPQDGPVDKSFPMLFDSSEEAEHYIDMIMGDGTFPDHSAIPLASAENILLH